MLWAKILRSYSLINNTKNINCSLNQATIRLWSPMQQMLCKSYLPLVGRNFLLRLFPNGTECESLPICVKKGNLKLLSKSPGFLKSSRLNSSDCPSAGRDFFFLERLGTSAHGYRQRCLNCIKGCCHPWRRIALRAILQLFPDDSFSIIARLSWYTIQFSRLNFPE